MSMNAAALHIKPIYSRKSSFSLHIRAKKKKKIAKGLVCQRHALPVAVCLNACTVGGKKELSLFYAPTGNKSASSHIYKLRLTYPFLHQSGQRPCVCVCVTEYRSLNRQQLLKSEGMTRCLRGDKDRQAWRKKKRRDGWRVARGPEFQIMPDLTIKYGRKGFRVSQKNEVLLFLGV